MSSEKVLKEEKNPKKKIALSKLSDSESEEEISDSESEKEIPIKKIALPIELKKNPIELKKKIVPPKMTIEKILTAPIYTYKYSAYNIIKDIENCENLSNNDIKNLIDF